VVNIRQRRWRTRCFGAFNPATWLATRRLLRRAKDVLANGLFVSDAPIAADGVHSLFSLFFRQRQRLEMSRREAPLEMRALYRYAGIWRHTMPRR
jgi:hypothetical protein